MGAINPGCRQEQPQDASFQLSGMVALAAGTVFCGSEFGICSSIPFLLSAVDHCSRASVGFYCAVFSPCRLLGSPSLFTAKWPRMARRGKRLSCRNLHPRKPTTLARFWRCRTSSSRAGLWSPTFRQRMRGSLLLSKT